MKAVVVKQPWAELIARGLKRAEFRTWNTKHRGPLLIVAGKAFDERGCCYLDCHPAKLEYGKAIAIVHLEDSVPAEKKHQYEPGYSGMKGLKAWEFGGVVRLDKPIAVKGRLGLFDVAI